MGLNDFHDRSRPTQIFTISGPKAISTGWRHTIVTTTVGLAYSFGFDNVGQLGLGTQTDYTSYSHIQNLFAKKMGIKSCSSRSHSMCILENGDVYSWGSNNVGQLGLGDIMIRSIPTKIQMDGNVSIVSVGGRHSLLLLENGEVYSVGDNSVSSNNNLM